MFIVFSFIPGFMLGIEFLWDEGCLVIDLGIVRMMFIPEESPPTGTT